MHIAQSFTRCRASCNGSLWCLAGGGHDWTWLMGLGRWKFFTCEVLENGGAVLRVCTILLKFNDNGIWKQVMVTWRYFTTWSIYILCLLQRTMFVLNRAESNVHWDYLPGFWMLLVRVAGIWCRTIGDWVVSNLNFRVFTKSLAANYRINLMTLIRHCMSPHYRCPLFSLFCDLSSNHVQHTMIAMWSTHCEESPPKKDCSLFPWISNLHGSTKHDLQRHDHHIFMLEELQ